MSLKEIDMDDDIETLVKWVDDFETLMNNIAKVLNSIRKKFDD